MLRNNNTITPTTDAPDKDYIVDVATYILKDSSMKKFNYSKSTFILNLLYVPMYLEIKTIPDHK